MAAIFEIFLKVGLVYFLDTLWVENFNEIAVSLTVKEMAYILCFFHFWRKFEKSSKWLPFLKIFEKWA